MKLLTHNMLTSKCMKGVSVGYPLGINVSLMFKVIFIVITLWGYKFVFIYIF